MPCDDPATAGLWIDQVKKARGFKIVFLGDSAVHGLASGTADQSLPAAVADLPKKQCPGKNIKVFNLVLEGGGPTKTFLIFNALAGAKIDLLVYDLNIAWFSRQKPLEHTNLLAPTDRYPDSVDIREIALQQPAAGEPVRGENLIKGLLAPHWKLRHHRILFIPLGGSHKGFARTAVNTAIVWAATGIWHGAAWHFLFWGLYHAPGLIVLRLYNIYIGSRLPQGFKCSRICYALSTAATFHFVAVGWIFFLVDIRQGLHVLKVRAGV